LWCGVERTILSFVGCFFMGQKFNTKINNILSKLIESHGKNKKRKGPLAAGSWRLET
jgi:hypothetical protein